MLANARENAGTARVVMKSAKLEWALLNLQEANQLIAEGIDRFPDNAKLWMMKGQILEQTGDKPEAITTYMEGLKRCPTSVPLWILCCKTQMSLGEHTKARLV